MLKRKFFCWLTISNFLYIVILIILAVVTINFAFGESGLITKANEAKIIQAVSSVKETINLEALEREMDKQKLTPEIMLAEGKVTRTVQQGEDENYHMYYALKDNAYEQMAGLGKGNFTELKDIFLIDDNLNIKYISKDGKEYGDNIEDKILNDETEIKFSSEAFSKYVSKISGIAEDKMKFKWMKNQTSLKIEDPNITSLVDLAFFPNLTSLTLGSYDIKLVPQITSMNGVENCIKLKDINLINISNIDYIAIGQLNKLTNFYKRYGDGKDFDNIIDALKSCENLATVNLGEMNISNMNRINELTNNIVSLILNGNKINKIEGLENKKNITTLDLSNNDISKVEGLEELTKLQKLYLQKNNIIDITPLSANISLKTLSLTGNPELDSNRENYTGERLEALNKIGEILDRGGTINLDIDKLNLFTNYKSLDFTNMFLSTLDGLEGITELTSLNLWNNKLTLEDSKSQEILGNMKKLQTLNLGYGKITNIKAIENLTNLTNLNLYENQLTDIKAINNLVNLKVLTLYGSKNNINLQEIEDIISNLDTFSISSESLKTIENCNISKITRLRLKSSSLTEIPNLSRFINLVELSLYNNERIINFENVSQIISLQTLDLSNCNLHNRMIEFSKLTNLTSLNLSGNTLWSEDLENLKALKNNAGLTIDLRNNSIIDASALLELDSSTKIKLGGNVNLTQESKTALQERFGSNVSF